MGYVTWPRPIQGRFDILRLGLAMFNPHIKFEMSTVTWNEEMKGNAKCKNYRFEPPFEGVRGNVHGSCMARWKAHGRLPISANWFFLASSHGCGTIKRKRLKSAFFEGVGHFERQFLVDGDVAHNPSMNRYIEEWYSYNFAAGMFHTKKLCSRLFRQKLKFTGKNSKIAFCATLWGT